MKCQIQLSVLIFFSGVSLFAADAPRASALSEMRVRYAKLQAQYERTRTDLLARYDFETNYNNESYRLDEFVAANSKVRELERTPKPLSSELGLSRIWNEARRIGANELRPIVENYLAGPENEVILHGRELQQTATDLAYTGRGGLSFSFRRAYHSNDTYDGPIGRGWDFFYNARIVIEADTAFMHMNGMARKFWRKDGKWESAPGNFLQLVQDGSNLYVYSGSLSRMEFEPSVEKANGWRLKSLASRHGNYSLNRIEVRYQEKSDRIQDITDPHGRVIRVCYDKEGRIAQLCSDVDDIRYSYDDYGCLVKVKSLPVAISFDNLREAETGYEYVKMNGRALLARRTNSGSACTYCVEYDKDGCVSRVGDMDATGCDARWQFMKTGNVVTIKPAAPAPSVEYVYDPSAAVSDLPVGRRVVALSAYERFDYSPEGLLRSEINVFGVRTEYRHDLDNAIPFVRGNVLLETTFPASATNGNTLARVVRSVEYAPGTSFPVLSQTTEYDSKGTEKVLSTVRTVYSKDWEVVEQNDNGIKTRYLQNKYGEEVLEMDAVGTASITRYADRGVGNAKQYKFEEGDVLGGGLVVSVVDDATDAQIKDVCARMGTDPWCRDALRVRPVARVSLYSYDMYGHQIASCIDGFVSLSVFNRDGDVLADYVPGRGLTLNEYSPSGLRITGLKQVVSPVAADGSVVANANFRGTFSAERLQRNAMGNVIAQTLTDEKVDGQSVVTRFERYPGGTLKRIIDSVGLTREDVYDAASGLLQKQVLVNGKFSQTLKSNIVYDFDGSVKESVDALGDRLTALRDDYGRPCAVIRADGVCLRKEMDGLDRVVSESSVKDGKELARKEYVYGSNGKLSSVYEWRIDDGKRERLLTQQVVYDEAGQVYATRGVREKSWTYRLLDGMGRAVATLTAGGEYDFSVFERGGVAMRGSFARDVKKTTNDEFAFLGGQMMFDDALGLPLVMMPIDRDWKDVPMRRTISRSNAIGQSVFAGTYGQTERTRYYNTLGWTIREITMPKSCQHGERDLKTEYTYSVDGKIKAKAIANRALLLRAAGDGSCVSPSLVEAPQTMEYEYDQLGRLQSIRQPDGLTVRRIYDEHSLPVEMIWTHATEPTKTLRHIGLEFGQLGRLLKINDKTNGKTIREYDYDDFGNRVRSVDAQCAGTVIVERKFDSLGTMTREKTSAGGHEFSVRHDVDLARGRDNLNFNDLLSSVGNRGFSSRNWREQETCFGLNGQVESVVLDNRRNAFATWRYLGQMPIEREVPESALKTVNKFDARGDLTNTSIYRRTFRFGRLDYRYDDFGNPVYSSTRLAEGAANAYENAQYSAFSSLRQLVAQNSESVILEGENILSHRDAVLGNGNKSFQALKTGRMAYDQAGNRWVDYRGLVQEDLSPEKFKKENLLQMLSPARVVKGDDKLSIADIYELASNREVTQAAFSNDVLTAKSNEYDQLGNMVKFEGRFWNGMCEYPVVWTLDFDALGRLSEMRGTLSREAPAMKVGESVAELRFLYDSDNRRIAKEVVDYTRIGGMPLKRKSWTVYDGNMQSVVFREEGDELYWAEQYLWKGQSRELVMACLGEDQAENLDSVKRSRYYFQQDRGLNTVCVTRSVGNNVLLTSGASYLGFGKNATMASVSEVRSSLGSGNDVSAAMNRQLDDQRLAGWEDEDGVQYLEVSVSERAILESMSIWHDGSFPREFRVYVPSGDVGSPSNSSNVEDWELEAASKGCLRTIQKETGAVMENRPIQVGLGARGNSIVIVWDGRASQKIRIREIEVSRLPNNPGSIAFAGQWFDRETGLYYQINRYRLPSGAFLSPDPLGFAAGDNLYAYANGNPLEWHDPDGKFPVHILLGALSGAVLDGGMYALQCWLTGEKLSWKELAIQACIGAATGAIAAATFGAVNASLVSKGSKLYKLGRVLGPGGRMIANSAAAGFSGGFSSGSLGNLSHGGDLSSALSSGLSSGGWGALGGMVGGGITAKFGASFSSAIAGGFLSGGAVGGARSFAEACNSGECFSDALMAGVSGSVKGAIYGAAVGAAAQGINKATKFGMDKLSAGRPAFKKGVQDAVFEAAKDSHGRVRDPKTGRYMSKNKPWDMGHKPGHEYRKQIRFAEDNMWTQEEFNEMYNDKRNYRPELPSSNRSHACEDMTDSYFGSNF